MYYVLKRAFTLIEILIVTAIIGILSIALVFSFLHQRDKATNARIKSDLSRLKTAFEDYYNDNNCYPPSTLFDDETDCGSSALSPYLASIPCSPRSNMPYALETDVTGCGWYKLYGELIDPANDPQAVAQYSASANPTLGNYGVSSSNTTVSVNFPLTSSPTSSTAPTNSYYCSSGPITPGGNGNCTSFNPTVENCTPNYSDPDCGGTHCPTAGTCTPK